MTLRYRDGIVPPNRQFGAGEQSLAAQLTASATAAAEAMAGFDHKLALTRIWDLVRRANAYVDEAAPWKLAKQAGEGDTAAAARLDTVLHHLIATLRQLGALIGPFLPAPSAAVLSAIGADGAPVPAPERWLEDLAGRTVRKPAALFPRIEEPRP